MMHVEGVQNQLQRSEKVIALQHTILVDCLFGEMWCVLRYEEKSRRSLVTAVGHQSKGLASFCHVLRLQRLVSVRSCIWTKLVRVGSQSAIRGLIIGYPKALCGGAEQ
jgi:hypothetical protein